MWEIEKTEFRKIILMMQHLGHFTRHFSKIKERDRMDHKALMTIIKETASYLIVEILNSMRSKVTIICCTFMLISCFNVSGQISAMYNDQGVLIADTNYRLNDKSVIPIMGGSNTAFQYKILTKLNYPAIMMDAGFGGLVVFEVKIEKDTSIKNLYNWNVYKVSSIDIVSDLPPVWGNQEMLEELNYLRERSFVFREDSIDIESSVFHIPVLFELIVDKEHKMEKYFEDGVFKYKGYVNEKMLKGIPNMGTPYKSGSE